MSVMKTYNEIKSELPNILAFIRNYIYDGEVIVIPVSGGLDSDVTARLCAEAVGNSNIHLFAVKQEGMENRYFSNIRKLAYDLNASLAVINIGDINIRLIDSLAKADKRISFSNKYILDPARANCSLRTAIISCYQDKGCIISACTNRTERELGFYMPFGDNLGHIKPIAHLYKTEVTMLAKIVGTSLEVISQPPSAAFWEGENDIEDIAYWIYNRGPVMNGRTFDDDDDIQVMKIKSGLTQTKIDLALEGLSLGKSIDSVAVYSGLSVETADALAKILEVSHRIKHRKLLAMIE